MTDLIISPKIRALAFIILGAIMVSFTSVLVELTHVEPTVSAFYRLLFGGAILLFIAWIRRDRLWFGASHFVLPLICAFLFALDLFFWHRSIIYVGPGLATILGNMQVFFVAFFAVIFLKEQLGWRLYIGIPIAVAGLFIIVQHSWGLQGGDFKWGVLLGILTALCYAGYILVLRKSQSANNRRRFSLFANMAWISILGAVMLGISVVIEPAADFSIPDMQTLWTLLGLGVMGQVLGWVLISKGLPDVNASVAGLALLLQPALAFMWDILFFARPTSTIEYAGAAIVLAGIYLGSSGRKEK